MKEAGKVERDSYSEHLSRIQTSWSEVCRAHGGPTAERQSAQRELLDRYGGAIRRYLLGGVRDADAADELFQDFACRFLEGNLKGATPGRGRFRNFLRGVLFHMVADHHRRKARRPRQLSDHDSEPAVKPTAAESQQAFQESWRDELLARAWQRLSEQERTKGQPLFTVLRFRADHPEMRSQELASELSSKLDREINAAAVRQMIHRARERFGELLLDDVAHSLEVPSNDEVEQELTELGLLEYCRPALEKRRP